MEDSVEEAFLSLDEFLSARREIMQSGMVGVTPLLKNMQYRFPELTKQRIKLYMKLENMQNTGSFKIRGIVYQINKLRQSSGQGIKFITMSAGNYGKAFAFLLNKLGLSGMCIMPDTSQQSKIEMIKSYGISVELCPTSEIQTVVDEYVVKEGFHFCHPFDDRDLIAGYGSIGLEIMNELPEFDILIICCGGGGLSSGVSAAVRTKLKSCRIYCVEPEGSPTMFQSFKNNMAVSIPTVKSVASGLSPPYAGKRAFQYCKEFIDDVILVTDDEILEAMSKLFNIGLFVEPSGCAAMAALLSNKIPDAEDKKVVSIISGGNISVSEVHQLIK